MPKDFLLLKVSEKNDPISPLQPKPRDTANSKRQIPENPTQRMNQETKLSVAIKPLPM